MNKINLVKSFLLNVCILCVSLAAWRCGPQEISSKDAETVSPGVALVESGELQAVNSKMVSVPHFKWEFSNNGRAKLLWLEEEGKQVSRGHIIARLDTSNIKRVMEQKEADLKIAIADVEKMKAEHASKMKELTADLQSAEAALRQAQIAMQRVKYESKAAQQIIELKLDIAKIELARAENAIEFTKNVQKEELLIEDEKIKQIKYTIENAKQTIDRFALRAPADGMVEHQRNRRSKEKVRVGDEFWRGRPLVGLPDLSKMKVETTVNESDIDKIHIGQRVIVRLDAYPKVSFEGEINFISITCREKDEDDKIKVFDVEVLLDEANQLLKPGMTVSCEILSTT